MSEMTRWVYSFVYYLIGLDLRMIIIKILFARMYSRLKTIFLLRSTDTQVSVSDTDTPQHVSNMPAGMLIILLLFFSFPTWLGHAEDT